MYTNVPPCNRCKKKDQACLFSETRPSHLYHQRRTDRATHGETANNSTLLAQGETARPSSRAIVTPRKHLELNHAQGAIRDLSLRSPYDFFTDEVKNNFLRCSYKWSFYHVPTLLRRVHERNVEEQIMWAILALAIRSVFNNDDLCIARSFATKALIFSIDSLRKLRYHILHR